MGTDTEKPSDSQTRDQPSVLGPVSLVSNHNQEEVAEASGPEADDAADEKAALPFSKARCIALVATVTCAAFLNTLSVQSVVIVMPTIGRELDIPESRLQWIVSSYSLTFGCFLLFWGRIADIFGKRLIFIGGSMWVTLMVGVNPVVPNEVAFYVFRALHGLGAAANVPTALGILGVTFPPGKAKNYAFSAYAAGAPMGSIMGNILSGFIAQYSDWKWVFGATAIMAGIVSITSFFTIPPPPPHMALDPNKSVDWIGAGLIVSGMVALMFALTQGNMAGWDTPYIPALIVVSIIIITAFVFWQRYLEKRGTKPPLVKVSTFLNLRFSAVMATMALFFAAFNNYLIFATYYYQGFQGLTPLQTMLRFLPTGIGGCVIAAIVAQLLSRIPTFYLLIIGTVATTVSCLLFAVPIPPSTSYFAWGLPAMLLAVVGADIAWPCLTLFTSHSLKPQDQAVGGALINAMGQFGRAIGLAMSTAVQTAVMARARGVSVQNVGATEVGEAESLTGIRAASGMNAGFAVAALLIVLVALRSKDIIGKARQPSPEREAPTGEETSRRDEKV
ncbi:major facilitator superfamily transporter [Stachybotrys elegans]|uniref:Major facilitator superfamily transporter n=1 Tax=Stachybotrys elegans TaxID=80388 RepID=A0A8K0T7E8_9HYPO|nr:major facilitator superfamily transporter [Stachybotrys elegans]